MTKMKVSNFQERITELFDSVSGNDADKGKMLGVSRQTISAWKTGVRSPKAPMIAHVASVFHVSVKWLSGFDVPMKEESVPDGVLPIETKKIPLLGEIACGEPIYAQEDLSAYVVVGEGINADFALRCKGDSMIGARIYDGDVVYIREQHDVENGEIAAVMIDDDATLKRVRKLRDGTILLHAENPRYADIEIDPEDETKTFRILGKAVSFCSRIL